MLQTLPGKREKRRRRPASWESSHGRKLGLGGNIPAGKKIKMIRRRRRELDTGDKGGTKVILKEFKKRRRGPR